MEALLIISVAAVMVCLLYACVKLVHRKMRIEGFKRLPSSHKLLVIGLAILLLAFAACWYYITVWFPFEDGYRGSKQFRPSVWNFIGLTTSYSAFIWALLTVIKRTSQEVIRIRADHPQLFWVSREEFRTLQVLAPQQHPVSVDELNAALNRPDTDTMLGKTKESLKLLRSQSIIKMNERGLYTPNVDFSAVRVDGPQITPTMVVAAATIASLFNYAMFFVSLEWIDKSSSAIRFTFLFVNPMVNSFVEAVLIPLVAVKFVTGTMQRQSAVTDDLAAEQDRGALEAETSRIEGLQRFEPLFDEIESKLKKLDESIDKLELATRLKVFRAKEPEEIKELSLKFFLRDVDGSIEDQRRDLRKSVYVRFEELTSHGTTEFLPSAVTVSFEESEKNEFYRERVQRIRVAVKEFLADSEVRGTLRQHGLTGTHLDNVIESAFRRTSSEASANWLIECFPIALTRIAHRFELLDEYAEHQGLLTVSDGWESTDAIGECTSKLRLHIHNFDEQIRILRNRLETAIIEQQRKQTSKEQAARKESAAQEELTQTRQRRIGEPWELPGTLPPMVLYAYHEINSALGTDEHLLWSFPVEWFKRLRSSLFNDGQSLEYQQSLAQSAISLAKRCIRVAHLYLEFAELSLSGKNEQPWRQLERRMLGFLNMEDSQFKSLLARESEQIEGLRKEHGNWLQVAQTSRDGKIIREEIEAFETTMDRIRRNADVWCDNVISLLEVEIPKPEPPDILHLTIETEEFNSKADHEWNNPIASGKAPLISFGNIKALKAEYQARHAEIKTVAPELADQLPELIDLLPPAAGKM